VQLKVLPVTGFQQNCSLVWCERSGAAAIVDPGGDLDRIDAQVRQSGVELGQILLTHAHCDHAGAVADLAERDGLPIIGPHRDDLFWIEALPEQSRMFGLPPARSFRPDRWLEHGDTVRVGDICLEVRHCPGHTPGHVVFCARAERLAWVGDVLFQGSIGRTDFPGGDMQTLLDSIRTQLLSLEDDVRFVPGHGPMSTIGRERRTNPFLRDLATSGRE
jgi:glyoxylase-like metal-dependent hydrolase (beta-lactamase superfamily II)